MNLGTDRVSVLFKKLFFPTLLGMLSISAVTTIDGIFVGHGVGSDGIAAVNICIPLLMALTGVGLMVGAGSSIVASVALSRGKVRQARMSTTHAMVAVVAVAAWVWLCILLAPDTISRWLGASEHLLPMVRDYLLWFAPSMVFSLIVAVALFSIRLDGAPRLAMWCSMIEAILNIVLDYVFIFPLGWGVMGAALATSISCFVGAMVAIVYLARYANTLRFSCLRLSVRTMRLFCHDLAEQCKLGSSALLGEMTMAVLFFVGNRMFMRYAGDDGVGAFGVCCYYLPFIFMVGNAIAQSAQPIISYNYGTGARTRVRETFRVSLVAVAVCGAVTTVAFMVFPRLLVGLFLPLDNAAAQIAVAGFPYCATGFLCFILNLSVIGFYQSMERIVPATTFALLRGCFFLIPCFLLLSAALGVPGIWLAMPLSELLTTCTIALYVLYHRHSYRLRPARQRAK